MEVTQTTEMRGGLSFTTHVKHACLWKKACPACVTAWVQTLVSNDKIQLEMNFFLYVVVIVCCCSVFGFFEKESVWPGIHRPG